MEIKTKLDRLNPAEYFAVLGILELTQASLAHFEHEEDTSTTFVITSDVALPDLKMLPLTAMEHADDKLAPVIVGDLKLDWWLDVWKREKDGLKLWSGNATPLIMLQQYQKMMTDVAASEWLQFSRQSKVRSCFGFDTRATRDALAVGYSQNDAKEPCTTYPFTEFLSAIGLQNFRPTGKKIDYYTWSRPIPISIAHAAAVMEVRGLQQRQHRITTRGKYTKEIDSVIEVNE